MINIDSRAAMQVVMAMSPVILVAAADVEFFRTALPPDIAVFGVVAVDAKHFQLVDVQGGKKELTVAPMLCLAMLATDQKSLALLTAAREIFSRWAAQEFPAPEMVPKGEGKKAGGFLVPASLTKQIRDYAVLTTKLSRELARLRSAHEYLHNAFSAVETYIGSSAMQPCRLVFENMPMLEVFLPGVGDPVRISQTLPMCSEGVSVLQLHIASVSAPPVKGLRIELTTLEDKEIHGHWNVPPEQLVPGWLTLLLHRGITGIQRTLELTITMYPEAGAVPLLSLGAPQPVRAFRVKSWPGLAQMAVRAPGAGLALRAWAGLPGVRPPNFSGVADVLRQDHVSRLCETAIPFHALRAIKTLPGGWQPGFAPIHVLDDLLGLLCHPPPEGFTIGVMERLPGRPASRISARAGVRHLDAGAVEFAMVLSDLPAEMVCARLAAAAAAQYEAGYATTGWVRVAPGRNELLSFHAPAFGGGANLYFATRMADGKTNDFAWAMFLDLRQTLFGPAGHNRWTASSFPALGSELNQGDAGAFLEPLEDVLSQVTQLAPALPQAGDAPVLVNYDPVLQGVFCHPPETGVTIGLVPHFAGRRRCKMRARLLVANEKAAPVEFCMVISALPPEDVQARLQSDAVLVSDEEFVSSGWQAASFGEMAHVEVSSPPAGDNSLYFATRMARRDSSIDFAWAFFTAFEVTMLAALEDGAARHG